MLSRSPTDRLIEQPPPPLSSPSASRRHSSRAPASSNGTLENS
ncbi:hypothetical protein [Streptomyces californicus]